MIKKLFSWAFLLFVFLSPLLALVAPLPLAEMHLTEDKRLVITGLLYLGLIGCALVYSLGKKQPLFTLGSKLLGPVTLLLSLYFVIGLFAPTLLPAYPFCFILLAAIALLFVLALRVHSELPSSGMVFFALTVLLLLSAELSFRRTPKEALAKNVRTTPPLVKPDQVNIVYRKNWFRSKQPCTDCDENLIRVVTMGGSSTYGVPMHYSSRTYAAELQRLLDERRPDESYEVLNGGVAAMGIVQIIAALNEEILQYEPDIVTVCEWFNDSAPQPKWYRMPGISDREAYQRDRFLRRLQEFPVYKQIRESKLYAVLRFYLLKARDAYSQGKSTQKKRKPDTRPRMTPEEYRWGLEEIVRMGKEHNFMPVFIVEAYHRTVPLKKFAEVNPYVREMLSVAKEHNILLVDPVTPMRNFVEPWLFYDFIHPNPAGHGIIAEAIYDTFYGEKQTPVSKAFWEKKGVDLTLPETSKKPFFQFAKSTAKNKNLVVRARAPFSTGNSELALYIDNEKTASRPGLNNSVNEFTFPLDELASYDPVLDIEFQTGIPKDAKLSASPIGSTGVQAPAYIEVVSGGQKHGWTSLIKVNGKRYDYNLRGFNAVVVGGKSGEVKHTQLFDFYPSDAANGPFKEFAKSLPDFYEGDVPPIVILSVKTDGHMNVDKKFFAEVSKSLGGSGALAKPFESFALIGVHGAPAGSAIEEYGPRLIKRNIGDKKILASQLIEIESVFFEER